MLSIVIPAYNEADRLPRTLRETLAWLRSSDTAHEIIVVDDGSEDQTAAIVTTMAQSAQSLRLIRLAQNSGKGFAVKERVPECFRIPDHLHGRRRLDRDGGVCPP